MKLRSFLTAIFCLAVSVAMAQGNPAPTVKVTFPKDAKAGAKVQGTIEVTFSDGLHGYQNPPSDKYQIPVTVTIDTKGFTLVKAAYPKGEMKVTGGDTKPTAVYEGSIKIPVTVTMPKKTGASEIKFLVSYQQCNDVACFPPAKVSGSVKLTIKK